MITNQRKRSKVQGHDGQNGEMAAIIFGTPKPDCVVIVWQGDKRCDELSYGQEKLINQNRSDTNRYRYHGHGAKVKWDSKHTVSEQYADRKGWRRSSLSPPSPTMHPPATQGRGTPDGGASPDARGSHPSLRFLERGARALVRGDFTQRQMRSFVFVHPGIARDSGGGFKP